MSRNVVAGEFPADFVRVELGEGLPDRPEWHFTDPPIGETYAEPAFGFVTLPVKYSAKGIRADRKMPFLLRAGARIVVPEGGQRLLLRSRTGARLFVDGKQILATKFASLQSDGHEEVPEVALTLGPGVRYLRPGQSETMAVFAGDGKEHVFVLEAVIGIKERRPEAGELLVAIGPTNQPMLHLLAPAGTSVALTDDAIERYEGERRAFHRGADAAHRRALAGSEDGYWRMRHEQARNFVAGLPPIIVPQPKTGPVSNDIDRFIMARLEAAGGKPAPLAGDFTFLRRVTLDTIGRIPTVQETEAFEKESVGERRAKAIDRLLDDPGWADQWVSYWQDVLAENPGIVKPMLNNTGPFRWFLHEALADNKPFDRFATELLLMEGSANYGGPAGFGIATENDVPLAQKAQIAAQAFLGAQLQCARCHDAPYHEFKQRDLFGLTAMLKRGAQVVPASSSIPTNANVIVGRRVKVTLPPGSKVQPEWTLTNIMAGDVSASLRQTNDTRERLAALITDPRNERFARVTVNRLWARFMGAGIVEPVDDWESARPSDPSLLEYLARELVAHDYDLKHVTRLILRSHTYQREARSDVARDARPEHRLFAAPLRRRMTAEQLVDSIFVAVGKSIDSEEMNLDVDGRRPVKEFNNLGKPYHAWELTSLSNERDRPALAMPKAQQVADTLMMFGWRESRQNPQTTRDDSPNVLQPATLANGLLANGRVARLSNGSALTELATRSDLTVPELTRETFLRLVSRLPTPGEQELFSDFLKPGFDSRLAVSEGGAPRQRKAERPVSWSNHLNPEATRIKQEAEREARAGDEPTARLDPAWRERMEDAVWALLNSPEFIYVP